MIVAAVAAACSSTSALRQGQQLYAGLESTEYSGYEPGEHFDMVREEIEAAIAAEPNGSLFGSSHHRTPFPYRLWIWNAFQTSEGKAGKWIAKTFGKAPVTIRRVNPELRASVAKSALRRHGYFRGTVGYEVVPMKNPKEAKIRYKVHTDTLFRVDTLSYSGFPAGADSLIASSSDEALLKAGDPFDISALDGERNRIAALLRNNGYYYYQPAYAAYEADTTASVATAALDLRLQPGTPPEARRPWRIGRVEMALRRQFMEQPTDSFSRGRFSVAYSGKKPPLRPWVVLADMKLRPGGLYSYEDHSLSAAKLNALGLFSSTDFAFSPRDTSAACDTLDLSLSCVFDKPYDFSVEANLTGKTSGWIGPGLKVALARRNAFRGGEKIQAGVFGSYEWQTGNSMNGGHDRIHSYEYGADISLELPRLLLPWRERRRRFHTEPSTVFKAATSVVNRAGYFKRHVVSGEMTYSFRTSATTAHTFSPLTLQYDYMAGRTAEFDSVLAKSPYLQVAMKDQFIPKMAYSVAYASPPGTRHPVRVYAAVSEAANLLSLAYAAAGEGWNEKYKTMFKNPYAQFVKVEADWAKTWQLSPGSQFVAHAAAGVAWAYGNSSAVPYSEQFYAGGANGVRAFNARSIGPGAYTAADGKSAYIDQTGDIKLLLNMEYRPRLFGDLHGALFIDAGNVWALRSGSRPGSQLRLATALQQTALGAGLGLRYDLGFFVVRADWGVAVHVPYRPGFINAPSFADAHSLHIAVGYPF